MDKLLMCLALTCSILNADCSKLKDGLMRTSPWNGGTTAPPSFEHMGQGACAASANGARTCVLMKNGGPYPTQQGCYEYCRDNSKCTGFSSRAAASSSTGSTCYIYASCADRNYPGETGARGPSAGTCSGSTRDNPNFAGYTDCGLAEGTSNSIGGAYAISSVQQQQCMKKSPVTTTTTTTAAPAASAVGDPHLTNINGKKFDIHDGLHRLVHFPRGSLDSEALLMIDGNATMMSGEQSCYNVFFQSAKISGKWVGDEILLQHDASHTGRKNFVLTSHGQHQEWSKLPGIPLTMPFTGTEPIKVFTKTLVPSIDMPGGDGIELSIGRKHPVFVEVWSSHGSNGLTHGQDVQYLNLKVRGLPANTGGLLGLDAYAKPAQAQCGLTSDEMGAMTGRNDLGLMELKTKSPSFWQASAQVGEQ